MAVIVTGSVEVGDWGECSTWRMAGGVCEDDEELGLPGVGAEPPAPVSLVASRLISMEKSLLPRVALRAWTAMTLVPPTR